MTGKRNWRDRARLAGTRILPSSGNGGVKLGRPLAYLLKSRPAPASYPVRKAFVACAQLIVATTPIDVAAAQEAGPRTTSVAGEGLQVFEPPFFARFKPVTALDMVR